MDSSVLNMAYMEPQEEVVVDEAMALPFESVEPAESLIERVHVELDRHYMDRRPLWGKPRLVSKGWTPSMLGEPNDRKLVAQMLGFRGDVFPRILKLIFEMGDDIEARWIKRFQALNMYVSSGKFIPGNVVDGLKFSGKYDIIIRDPKNPVTQYVVEIKSISPNGFRQLPYPSHKPDSNYDELIGTKGEIGMRVRKYMHQLQTYLYGMNMDDGVLLFDNKGTQEYHLYHIRKNDDHIAAMRERLLRLQTDFWGKNLIPPWNGGKEKSFFATYKPTEAVPLIEMIAEYKEEGATNVS